MTTETQATEPTALSIIQPGGPLAEIGEQYGGFASLGMIGFDSADLMLPRVVIVNGQNQTIEWEAKPGQFHDTSTGENFDALEGFVIGVGKGQIWSLPYSEAQQLRDAGQEVPIYCKSNDGVKPEPEFTKAPAAACRICPKARATRKEGGGWKAPECSNSLKMLVATWNPEVEDYDVRLFVVSKTATGPISEWVKKMLAKKKPVWSWKVRFTTQKETGNGNVWFLPVVTELQDQPIPAEHQGLMAAKMEAYLPILAKVDAKDSVAHDAGEEARGAAPDTYTGGPTIDASAASATSPAPPPPPQSDVPPEDDIGF